MKGKGSWIALWLIVLAGLAATVFVRQGISAGAEARAAETAVVSESVAVSETAIVSEAAPSESVGIVSEDGPAAGNGPASGNGPRLQAGPVAAVENEALTRLEELDKQIGEDRDRSGAKNASSRKAAAESEWNLWEAEVRRLLETLKDLLGTQEQEQLMEQQKSWLKEREAKALEASGRQPGSNLEQVNYYRSLAEATRQRAYDLAEEYAAYFQNR